MLTCGILVSTCWCCGASLPHSWVRWLDYSCLLSPVGMVISSLILFVGILGDKVSSFNTWPFYLTAGTCIIIFHFPFFPMYVATLLILYLLLISGAFASMIGYYFKLMRGIPIPSVGAVSCSQIVSAFFYSLVYPSYFSLEHYWLWYRWWSSTIPTLVCISYPFPSSLYLHHM